MKLTIFLEYYPPYQGSDRAIFELTQHLDKSKFELNYVMIPPLRALWEFNQKKYGLKRLKYLFKAGFKKIKGVEQIFLPSWLLKLWTKKLYLSFIVTFGYLFFKLIKLKKLRISNFNIINHPSPFSGLLSFLTSKLFMKKILMGCPDLISAYGTDVMGTETSYFKNVGLKILEKFLIGRSHRIFAINDYIRDYLVNIGIDSKKIEIIPNGVDANFFSPKYSTDNFKEKYALNGYFNIIYIGHIEKWAGVYEIIEAAKLVNEKHPKIQFLLVGDGIDRNKLEKENISANVKFFGFQPYESIPYFIKSSDLAIITFPNTPMTHATSPIKVFEYMAMKKPIISSYIHGIRDVIQANQNGIFIYNLDPKNIAKKILDLYKNEELRERLGEEARKTILKKYDWNIISKKFEEFLILSMKQ